MASISAFRSAIATGGGRANQFEVLINPPPALQTTFTQQDYLLCKAASLPTSTIAEIPVPYRGKTVHFAGERSYAPWTVTFFNTISPGNNPTLFLRTFFEQWHSVMQRYSGIEGEVNHIEYVGSADVRQLDRNDKVAYEYSFVNLFPTEVSEIALSYDTENAIEEFTVTFVYDYFVSTALLTSDDNATEVPNSINAITGDL